MVLSGHTNTVDQLSWDPTRNDRLATASSDKTVRLWDSRSTRVVLCCVCVCVCVVLCCVCVCVCVCYGECGYFVGVFGIVVLCCVMMNAFVVCCVNVSFFLCL